MNSESKKELHKEILEKLSMERKVTVITSLPSNYSNKFPCLEDSGEDKPLRAKINKIPEIR